MYNDISRENHFERNVKHETILTNEVSLFHDILNS